MMVSPNNWIPSMIITMPIVAMIVTSVLPLAKPYKYAICPRPPAPIARAQPDVRAARQPACPPSGTG